MKAKCEQSWTPTKQMKAVGEAVWGGGGVDAGACVLGLARCSVVTQSNL